jgi:hypothetical protein
MNNNNDDNNNNKMKKKKKNREVMYAFGKILCYLHYNPILREVYFPAFTAFELQ